MTLFRWELTQKIEIWTTWFDEKENNVFNGLETKKGDETIAFW